MCAAQNDKRDYEKNVNEKWGSMFSWKPKIWGIKKRKNDNTEPAPRKKLCDLGKKL